MDRFLVNMAIVKVNFDQKGTAFLDNYIPLVHEALDKIEGDVFSVDEFKNKFTEIAEFDIPTGAILSLLKRAERKYSLLLKDKGLYKIQRQKLDKANYLNIRDDERRKYESLKQKFIEFCRDELDVVVDDKDASSYFFEVLYEIAPALFMKISDIDSQEIDHSEKNKYRVAKFVTHANVKDQDSFNSILSFVRGSMLTETFYYSQNTTDITDKPMRKVTVYFDTQFLIRLLGYGEEVILSLIHI